MPLTLLLLALLGCPKQTSTQTGLLQGLLFEADALWDQRAEAGLAAVDSALQRAYAIAPDDPDVLWRLTRLRVAESRVEDAAERRVAILGQARAMAWSCLRSDGQIAALERESGVSAALAEVTGARQGCVGWGAFAWARWLVEFGADAGALDLDTLDALIRAARTSNRPDVQHRGRWAEALVLGARPGWSGGDPAAARDRLRALAHESPSDLELAVDLHALYERGSTEAEGSLERLRSARPVTPEERAVVARVLARADRSRQRP